MKFSDSFSDLWPALAQDLGAQSIVVEDCDDCELEPAALDSAAIVLAAGGAEPQVLDWLSRHEAPVGIPLFAVGSDPGRRIAIQVVSQGARDYFALPEDIETLQNSLASAIERHRQAMRRSARRGEEAKNGAFSEIVGESDALKLLLDRASRILHHADATLLIIGETGTGKELIARAIHDGGPRRGSPFVAVNCSALPDRLIESELFGHERGAFTDARAPKPGLFEVAEGGTLFLDEIGDLPVELQAKFLRVLQDKQVRRVGGTKWRKVDVRIIAATNEDLSAAMKNGSFRQDLYYRLSVITLALPPLPLVVLSVVLLDFAIYLQHVMFHAVPVLWRIHRMHHCD
ncbi:MAG: sigma 54-interacting transcriptional regulator, partial [Acidiferrobacterales bacterium]